MSVRTNTNKPQPFGAQSPAPPPNARSLFTDPTPSQGMPVKATMEGFAGFGSSNAVAANGIPNSSPSSEDWSKSGYNSSSDGGAAAAAATGAGSTFSKDRQGAGDPTSAGWSGFSMPSRVNRQAAPPPPAAGQQQQQQQGSYGGQQQQQPLRDFPAQPGPNGTAPPPPSNNNHNNDNNGGGGGSAGAVDDLLSFLDGMKTD